MENVMARPRNRLLSFLGRARSTRLNEEQMARENRHLARALAEEKRNGQRIAAIARTLALAVIAVLLPFLNFDWSVLYYEFLLLVFVAIGWAQIRVARVGRSDAELALVFADLALLTFTILVPNPFLDSEMPTAFMYRFDNFIYFFILLAVGTLAYSWRTVLTIGSWTALLWVGGLATVNWYGHRLPHLTDALAAVAGDNRVLLEFLDPNSTIASLRVQEIVVFLIVAAILALKGYRTNQLIMRQATIAAERANLSRYFPQNLVDVLASAEHDVGAVRTQEVAVLFADIVGFTEIAERHPPQKVMELLRRYHSVLENAVFAHGGTLDKYLGDGVMATFGTPLAGPDDAANALAAARRIVADMDECSRDCAARGDPRFRVSVGLHFGTVILGDIGPPRRLEFAAVGDTVNVASRLESVTRELGCHLVVSDSVVARLKGRQPQAGELVAGLEPRPGLRLRGRATPIDVWIA